MPEQMKTSSKKDPVYIGIWNAVKKASPESQGKAIVSWYEKLRFPKSTPEEKKLADRMHTFLKKHEKGIGWTAVGVEAAVFTAAVAKGYSMLRDRTPVNQMVSPTSEPKAFGRFTGIDHDMEIRSPGVEGISPKKWQDLLEFRKKYPDGSFDQAFDLLFSEKEGPKNVEGSHILSWLFDEVFIDGASNISPVSDEVLQQLFFLIPSRMIDLSRGFRGDTSRLDWAVKKFVANGLRPQDLPDTALALKKIPGYGRDTWGIWMRWPDNGYPGLTDFARHWAKARNLA